MGLIEKLEEIKTKLENYNPGGSSGGDDWEITYPAYLFYYGLRSGETKTELLKKMKNCKPIYYNTFGYYTTEEDIEVDINYMIENHYTKNDYYGDKYKYAILQNMFSSSNLTNITLNLKDKDTILMLGNTFTSSKKLISVNSNADIIKTNYIPYIFKDCSLLEHINFTIDVNGCLSAANAFQNCAKLKEVILTGRLIPTYIPYSTSPYKDLSNMYNTSTNYCTIANMFNGCSSLEKIIGLDITNIGNITTAFSNCTSLKTLDFSGTENVQVNIDLKTTGLDATGLMNMLNTLPDISNSTSRTLTIGSTKLALLTDEQIAEFNMKGYSLA